MSRFFVRGPHLRIEIWGTRLPCSSITIGGTLAECDPFGIPSTSRWTGAVIIGQFPRTKTCIATRSKT